ncbi:MAG: PEGA domain-containing protein [Methanomicrobiales archaeon]|nr:PEGA domain-containing protein [Methanomicrobiales archaeon]
MKFRLVILVILFGVLIAGSVALPSGGTLYVASKPSGATILINGTDYGTTDLFVKDVPAGVQNLTLVKEGYQPETVLVDVPAGSLKVLAPITLTKSGDAGIPGGSGTLYVASKPSGATILINGTDYGTTDRFVKDVPAGVQNLTLVKEGYQPETVLVDVPAGGLKVLAPITLTKSGDAGIPGGTGTLYVATSPSGATILINGTDYGTTSRFVKDVPAGVQNLMLVKEGYQPETVLVDVPAGGLKVLAPITLTTMPGGEGEVENIQAAVDAASDGDTIILKKGTYYENVVIDKSVTIIGFGPGTTVINGETGENVVEGGVINITKPHLLSSGPTVTLIGMTITGGDAHYGGGIFNDGGSLSLSWISIQNNAASLSGGGIYTMGGTVTMEGGSVITDNTAPVGGGMFNDGGILTMNSGSSITANMADIGGGLVNIQGTVIMNNGSSITNNSATYDGGGIYSYYYSTITLNGGSITGNTAENGTGGGIYIDSTSTVNQVGGTVSGNYPDDISYEFDVTYLGATAGTISIDTQDWSYIVNLSGLAPDTEYWVAGEGLPDIFASGMADTNGDLRLQGVLNPAPNLRTGVSIFFVGTGLTPPTAGQVTLDGKECSGGITSTGLFGTLKEDGTPLAGKKVEFYTYDPFTLDINYPSFGSDTTDSDGKFCKVFFGGHLGENIACEYDGTWDMNMEKASSCPIC